MMQALVTASLNGCMHDDKVPVKGSSKGMNTQPHIMWQAASNGVVQHKRSVL
jgi:hypothetical protein